MIFSNTYNNYMKGLNTITPLPHSMDVKQNSWMKASAKA
jgi:hypothetical protein